MDWFLYDRDLHHERVNSRLIRYWGTKLIKELLMPISKFITYDITLLLNLLYQSS